MEYISAKEASISWGVTLRYVQRLLHDKRIEGAKKFGNSWLIPATAKKPADARRKATVNEKPTDKNKLPPSPYLACGTLSSVIPMPCESADGVLTSLHESSLLLQFESEIAYFKGDFERAKKCFRNTQRSDKIKLCAALTAMTAAVSTGDYALYTEISAFIKGLTAAHDDDRTRTSCEMISAVITLSMFIPDNAPNWLINGRFASLDNDSKPFALYLYIKYLQTAKQYEAVLAASVTALTLSGVPGKFTFQEIYFYLFAAHACLELSRRDEAISYIDKALDIALPNSFITPLAEHLTMLGGVLEKRIARRSLKLCEQVTKLSADVIKNWVSFHNLYTKDNITLMLTLRECHVARLLVRGATYKDAAKEMNMSVGSLNNLVSEIYSKLYIHSKHELAAFIL